MKIEEGESRRKHDMLKNVPVFINDENKPKSMIMVSFLAKMLCGSPLRITKLMHKIMNLHYCVSLSSEVM